MSQIGIKLANYDFFPIIEGIDSLPVEKKIELTTVRDGQATVQINLYKKDGEQEELRYIGSLIIEDLKEGAQGNATILLSLNLNKENHLVAEAVDKETGNKQSFGISLNDLNQETLDMFDFDLDEPVFKDMTEDVGNVSDIDLSFTDFLNSDADYDIDENVNIDDLNVDQNIENSDDIVNEAEYYKINDDIFSDEDALTKDMINTDASNEEPISNTYLDDLDDLRNEKSSFPKWLKIFLVILLISVLALIIALVLKNRSKSEKIIDAHGVAIIEDIEENKEAEIDRKQDDEEVKSIDSITAEPPQKMKEPFERPRMDIENKKKEDVLQQEKVEQQEVKQVTGNAITKEVTYKLKNGDTLWDLADNFYKNPWKYKKIAKFNGIKNPNLIIVGRNIKIPAK